jgi:MFS family permease
LWRHTDFVRLWLAQTVSEFGSQFTLLALPLAAILVLHATAFEVAVLSTVEFLPFLLFGVVAGVWVDRLSYRLVLVVADFGRAFVLASVPLAYAFGALTLPHLYAVGFLSGTLTVFFSVAYSAYLPSLLERERLAEGNAKLEVSRSLAQTSGPATAGGVISAISAPVAILIDAASFLVSGFGIVSIHHREQRRVVQDGRSVWHELREGLSYVWREPILRTNVYSAGLANFAYGMIWAIFLVFAIRILELHAGVIGLIIALGEAGGIIGAIAANRIAGKLGVGPTMIVATAIFGVGNALIALAPRSAAIPFLTAGWAIASFGALITAVIGPTIRQAIVPQRLQGRVVGAIRSVIRGIVPLGSLTAGVLAATIGIRHTLLVAAALACTAFVPLIVPLRTFYKLPPNPETI